MPSVRVATRPLSLSGLRALLARAEAHLWFSWVETAPTRGHLHTEALPSLDGYVLAEPPMVVYLGGVSDAVDLLRHAQRQAVSGVLLSLGVTFRDPVLGHVPADFRSATVVPDRPGVGAPMRSLPSEASLRMSAHFSLEAERRQATLMRAFLTAFGLGDAVEIEVLPGSDDPNPYTRRPSSRRIRVVDETRVAQAASRRAEDVDPLVAQGRIVLAAPYVNLLGVDDDPALFLAALDAIEAEGASVVRARVLLAPRTAEAYATLRDRLERGALPEAVRARSAERPWEIEVATHGRHPLDDLPERTVAEEVDRIRPFDVVDPGGTLWEGHVDLEDETLRAGFTLVGLADDEDDTIDPETASLLDAHPLSAREVPPRVTEAAVARFKAVLQSWAGDGDIVDPEWSY